MGQSGTNTFEQDCETALGWIARLRSDAVATEDYQAFALWLAEDSSHQQAMDAMLALWSDLACVQYLPVFEQPSSIDEGSTTADTIHFDTQRQAANSQRWWGAGLATAATLALAVVLWPSGASQNDAVRYQTAVGEQRAIELADGSTITLNTDTRIAVRYEQASRYIKLIRGEAMFEVTTDSQRPFEVESGYAEVTVLGTTFNIQRTDDTSDITVLEGVVRVAELRDNSTRVAATEVLRANQQLRATRDGLDAAETVDPGPLVAWQYGQLIAREMPLPEFVDELQRYQDTHILIGDHDVAAMTVSGVFELSQPESILHALEVSHGLVVVAVDDRTVQLLKANQ